MSARTPDEVHHGGNAVLLQISNEMVRIYKDQLGRGPTQARTTWSGDVITAVLEGTLTSAERHLVHLNQHQRIRDLRLLFQYTAVREFCEPIERLTGRRVRAFVSGIDTCVDGLSTEVFVLHPQGHEGPPRWEATTSSGFDESGEAESERMSGASPAAALPVTP